MYRNLLLNGRSSPSSTCVHTCMAKGCGSTVHATMHVRKPEAALSLEALLCLCASSSIRYVIIYASATTKMYIQLNTNSRRRLHSYTSPLHTTNIGQYRQHARHSASRGRHALNQDTRRLRFVQHNRRAVRPSALRAAREDPRQHWRP